MRFLNNVFKIIHTTNKFFFFLNIYFFNPKNHLLLFRYTTLTLSCTGDFQTHISKCSERWLNYFFYLYGHLQQKFLKGHEFSGMGFLEIFWVKSKKPQQGGVYSVPSPCFRGLRMIKNLEITFFLAIHGKAVELT